MIVAGVLSYTEAQIIDYVDAKRLYDKFLEVRNGS
jgi:hypothetical protein